MPHNLHHRIIIISARRMNGYTSRLVYNNHVVVFVYYSDRLCGDGRLMAMQRVGNDISVPQDRFWSNILPVDSDFAIYDCISLPSN
jgi:hypothetical protein